MQTLGGERKLWVPIFLVMLGAILGSLSTVVFEEIRERFFPKNKHIFTLSESIDNLSREIVENSNKLVGYSAVQGGGMSSSISIDNLKEINERAKIVEELVIELNNKTNKLTRFSIAVMESSGSPKSGSDIWLSEGEGTYIFDRNNTFGVQHIYTNYIWAYINDKRRMINIGEKVNIGDQNKECFVSYFGTKNQLAGIALSCAK
ncbi:hypothetical protein SAMN05660860_00273 [Geoalkalibacter ferrihydriticus]|uniref:Uncharacterized protein n=2 Tax=Geoalkalibacter ferrihydriticus TaxID=392333 RepID=A0A0C2EAL0_9BACT|nr:hypothetical protein [Geoalkalibacter ferrihydriticus]KIH75598.1 hypothetical protein GFER_15775 [Geoalkalibacter ferrihydriticus DSM 17813]SDL29977.1 hypothetical protein SAMN05660860_00273 [Geoalkalibacter ferrihydriticus]